MPDFANMLNQTRYPVKNHIHGLNNPVFKNRIPDVPDRIIQIDNIFEQP